MSSLNDNGENTDSDCEIINNFNAQFHDENESKYLHVIDYDIQDPDSVTGNFQRSKNGQQSLKDTTSNTSDNSSDVYSDFATKHKEADSNYRQECNHDKQLASNANPRRLDENQIKPSKNVPGYNNMDVEIEHGNFEGDKQPRSKVKNMIHDYECHVQEQSSRRKSEKKHREQSRNSLDINSKIVASCTDHGSVKSHINHISPANLEELSLNKSSPFHEQAVVSQAIVTKSDSKVNDTVYRHLMTKENNTGDIPDSNSREQFPGPISLQSSPLDKKVSEPEHSKPAYQIIKTRVDYAFTEEPITTSAAGSKQSANTGDENSYSPIKSRYDNHQTVIDNYDRSTRSNAREMRSDHPVENYLGGSQVTRAHWYDIHGSLPKSSQQTQSLILEEGNAFKQTTTEENTCETLTPLVDYDLRRGNSFNASHHRRWKSLGELDRVDQVEEYKLPEKLNKIAYPVANEQGTSRVVDNVDTMYLGSIPSNRDFNSLPRHRAVQHDQNGNRTDPFTFHTETLTQSHTPGNRNYIQNDNNSQTISLGIRHKITWPHNAKGEKQSTTQGRNKYVPNKYNARNLRVIASTDYRQPYSLIERNLYNANDTVEINPSFKRDETTTMDAKTSKQSSFLANEHGQLAAKQVDKNTDLSLAISDDDFTSSSLKRWNYSPTKRSSSPTRKHGTMPGRFQDVTKPSDYLNHLTDHNNNLSRSLTNLETLDQSPMKRSPKIKNLVDIEYYDIASDEELNSKITCRPRTKSLNDENKTSEYVLPKREYKSSGDLRSVGLAQQEIVAQNEDNKTSSRFDLSSGGSQRTHGKYKDLYENSVSKGAVQGYNTTYPILGTKTNPFITVSSHDKHSNRYERYSQEPQTSNTEATMDRASSNNGNKHYAIQNEYERSNFAPSNSVEYITQKDNRVQSVKTSFTNDLKQNQSRIKSPLHNSKTAKINYTANHQQGKSHVSTAKWFRSPLQNRCTSRIDNSRKHQAKNIRDPALKSNVYSDEHYKLTQGKYNIAEAEAEWRKRYGKLPYSDKDPLHQSSDKEFGRLFQHSEKSGATQSSSEDTGLVKQHFTLEENIGDTSSSSVFDTNTNDDPSSKNRHSKDFSATLNKLSSYLLSGYKDDLTQTSPLRSQEEPKSATTVKFRKFYLDDEGDLSHVLDDPKESPKLSMLVHAIIRLREVYSVQLYAKSQTPDHPINLGNPQLRDAIQNKPMSVVKDLILANKSVDINIRSQSGDSALHRAATDGDLDAIRIMINHGANVNIRDRGGFQPVHQALRCHNYKAAMFLMDCGTDLMSYTSKRIQEFVNVKAIAKQYLRQTLKTPL